MKTSELNPIAASAISDDNLILFGASNLQDTPATSRKITLADLKQVGQIRVAATVAAMQALVNAKDNQLFQTLGYSTEGVGANLYRYDAASAVTADGGFVITATGMGVGRFVAVNQDVLRPEQWGAVYESADAGVLSANVTAITNMMSAVTKEGGYVELLPGSWLGVNAAWPMPQGNVSGSDTPFPLTINGNGSMIRQSGSTASLFTITRLSPLNPAVIPVAEQARRVFRDLFISSSSTTYGVNITNAGKDIHFDNVWITCPAGVGLRINETYGSYFANVYVYKCGSHGIEVSDVNVLTLSDVTVRQNGGDGLHITDTTNIFGQVYAESNDGWGMDCINMVDCLFRIYTEANHYTGVSAGSRYRQARLRNCYNNVLSGKSQSNDEASYDLDGVSRIGNKFGNEFIDHKLLPRPIITKQHVSLRNNWTAEYNVGFRPTVTRLSNGKIELVVPQDANANRTGTSNWWSISQNSGGVTIPEWDLTFVVGEQFLMTLKVEYDQAALTHFQLMNDNQASHTYAGYIAIAVGGTTIANQALYLTGAPIEQYSIPFEYPVGGAADPIIYFFPTSTAANQPGPAADIKYTFHEMNVHRLSNVETVRVPEVASIALADTTPSVLGVTHAKTVNTSATTITNFDDGVVGQTIMVHITEANTGISGGSGITLGAAGDYAAQAGGALFTFRRDGSTWYEVTRSVF